MNKSESKYFHTASLMNQAFLLLLDQKPYEYITVKEVCEKAGVNRSTFYLHYESMADLVVECFRRATEKMREKYSMENRIDRRNLLSCPMEEVDLIVPKYLAPYLEFIKENKTFFRIMAEHSEVFALEERFLIMDREIFEPILERYHFPDWEKKYWIAFYMNGILSVVREWLKSDCADGTDDIVGLLLRCIHKVRAGHEN